MSLNYIFGNISTDVRMTIAPDRSIGYNKGDPMMNPVSKSLIFVTMALGMGSITEKNYEDFYKRLRYYETLHGPILAFDNEELKHSGITLADIKAHIGLYTNVSFETDAKWRKRIYETWERDYEYALKSEANKEPFYKQVDEHFRHLAEQVPVQEQVTNSAEHMRAE